MKKIKVLKWFAPVVMVILAASAVTSCNSKSEFVLDDNWMYDMVTLVQSNDDGSVVTLQKDGDSRLVTLTFTNRIDTTKAPIGSRIWIAYWPMSGVAYTSGPADLKAWRWVYNAKIQEGTKDSTHQWMTKQQEVQNMWRTGNWLNVVTYCSYTNEAPKEYRLVVDSTTLDSEYPEAYLLYDDDQNPQTAQTLLFYASFDISSVWNLPHVKGLRVTASGYDGKYMRTFIKPVDDVLQPGA